jgi:hypothetical protein
MQRHFLQKNELTKAERRHPDTVPSPVWVQVSTEWAQGSSGSAVIDLCGNVIGHVSEIQTMLEDSDASIDNEDATTDKPAAKPEEKPATDAKPEELPEAPGTVIVFHDAIAACNVKALIKP